MNGIANTPREMNVAFFLLPNNSIAKAKDVPKMSIKRMRAVNPS